MDEWHFWHSQLAGLEPETTPGKPWSGYYMLRRRTTRDNDDPNRRPGDARKKVTTTHLPVAIWFDDGWNCRIGADEYITDVDVIDQFIFSRCCRAAITFEEYERAIDAANLV